MSDNTNSNGQGIVLFYFMAIFGFAIYIALIMPIKLILKNRTATWTNTIEPFGDFISLPAALSFICYGGIFILGGTIISGQSNWLVNYLAIASTVCSIYCAVMDVKNMNSTAVSG